MGSVLGMQYVAEHPEKVSSYIGVGQVIHLKEESKNDEHPRGDREKTMYQFIFEAVSSPDISLQDFKWFLLDSGKTNANNPLRVELENFDANKMNEYQVPMYFVSGSNDFGAPLEEVKKYYEKMSAPEKDFMIIEGAGHATFLDVPDEFAEAVKEVLLSQ